MKFKNTVKIKFKQRYKFQLFRKNLIRGKVSVGLPPGTDNHLRLHKLILQVVNLMIKNQGNRYWRFVIPSTARNLFAMD